MEFDGLGEEVKVMAFVAEGSGYLELEEIGELGEFVFLGLIARNEPFGSGILKYDAQAQWNEQKVI